MIRSVAVLAVVLVLTGCSAPTTTSDSSESATPKPAASSAAASGGTTPKPTPSPTPTPPAGFRAPETCDEILPPDVRAAFAGQGLVARETQLNPELPIGDPYDVTPYGTAPESKVFMTDYRNCVWAAGERMVYVFVGEVDPASRPFLVDDFAFFAIRPIDTTAPVLVVTWDGVIPGVALASGSYWVLRTNSVIKVDIEPGGEPARQEAQTLSDQVTAYLKAD